MKKTTQTTPPAEEHPQRRLFKRTRAGVTLSREEVQQIKARRRELRKELRQRGIKDKDTFELYAGSEGAYFDKRRGFLPWLLHGRALWALLGAALAGLLALFLISAISQMRGYFTINLSDGLFKDGFVLSETKGFEQPSVNLTAEPAVDVPCISVAQLPEDLDETDGQHNGNYFAYTFYIRNEGENTVDYDWTLELTDEADDLSTAVWAMVFEDGKMSFYAKANSTTGKAETLPAPDDNSRGYLDMALRDLCKSPDQQYQVIAQRGQRTWYRLIPYLYESEDAITSGSQQSVAPMDVHKYTVVLWLEGDDPDCTDALRNGHLGVAMQFRLVTEEDADHSGQSPSWTETLRNFFRREG